VYVKTDSEASSGVLQRHFDSLPFDGRVISAELISELDFFQQFPLVTPF